MTKKNLLRLGLLAALGIGLWIALRGRTSSADRAVKFVTTVADIGPISARVTATGTLSALVTVQVGSQVSGRLQGIHVDFNSTVKKGQLLAKIDPQMFRAARQQAHANFVAARANLAKVRVEARQKALELDRAVNLAAQKILPTADLDAARAAAEAARASVDAASGNVEQARAALNQANVNLEYTTILSPIDGVVISRNVDVGQTVAASLQAPTLFVLAEDLRKMQVDTSVAEADIGKLEAGMAATFSVDAYPGEKFAGKLRQIRSAPQTVQNVVTYDAVVDVANPELKLRPGMTANVTFVYAYRKAVLRVPNAALRFRPTPEVLGRLREAAGEKSDRSERKNGEGPKGDDAKEAGPEKRTIWVLRAQKPVRVAVRTGVTDGTQTEAEGEVRSGEAVITDAEVQGASSSRSHTSMPPSLRRAF